MIMLRHNQDGSYFQPHRHSSLCEDFQCVEMGDPTKWTIDDIGEYVRKPESKLTWDLPGVVSVRVGKVTLSCWQQFKGPCTLRVVFDRETGELIIEPVE